MSEQTKAVATVHGAEVQKTDTEGKPNSGLVKARAAIPECKVLKRLEDQSADGILATITNMTGDPDFAKKFVAYTKIQVRNSWRKGTDAEGKPVWYNLFDKVPVDSVLECLYSAARRGVLPDGYNAYLVVYLGKNPRCQLLVDYKGLCDCAIADGICSDVGAVEVCANDDIEINFGEVTRLNIDAKNPRGEIIGCVGWAILPNGRRKTVYVDLETLEAIRACAQSDNIWKSWTVEMYKKTAIRRLFKTMRNSPRMRALMEADDESYNLDEPREPRENGPRSERNRTKVKLLSGAKNALPAPVEAAEAESVAVAEPAAAAEAEPEIDGIPLSVF